MKTPLWTQIQSFSLGTLCAALTIGLGLVTLALTRVGIDALVPSITGDPTHFAKPWVDALCMIVFIVSAVLLCFYGGVLCASFWRRAVKDARQKQWWSACSALLLFTPVIPAGLLIPYGELGSGIAASFLAWSVLTVASFLPYITGIYYGLKWQPLRRWRHFVGLPKE